MLKRQRDSSPLPETRQEARHVHLPTILLCVILSGDDEREFHPRRVLDTQPPIVDASFLRADQVEDRVSDEELVIGVVIDGAARAYPINMLCGPRREIINDSLGGKAIAATW